VLCIGFRGTSLTLTKGQETTLEKGVTGGSSDQSTITLSSDSSSSDPERTLKPLARSKLPSVLYQTCADDQKHSHNSRMELALQGQGAGKTLKPARTQARNVRGANMG